MRASWHFFCSLASLQNTWQAFIQMKCATSKCNYATLQSIMFAYASVEHKIKSCDFQFSTILTLHPRIRMLGIEASEERTWNLRWTRISQHAACWIGNAVYLWRQSRTKTKRRKAKALAAMFESLDSAVKGFWLCVDYVADKSGFKWK